MKGMIQEENVLLSDAKGNVLCRHGMHNLHHCASGL